MHGYMAPPLKPESRFFVLTREPLALCPFCQSDAEWPADIVVVYLEGDAAGHGGAKVVGRRAARGRLVDRSGDRLRQPDPDRACRSPADPRRLKRCEPVPAVVLSCAVSPASRRRRSISVVRRPDDPRSAAVADPRAAAIAVSGPSGAGKTSCCIRSPACCAPTPGRCAGAAVISPPCRRRRATAGGATPSASCSRISIWLPELERRSTISCCRSRFDRWRPHAARARRAGPAARASASPTPAAAPRLLSRGEQQRVAIARALVRRPDAHPGRRAHRQPRRRQRRRASATCSSTRRASARRHARRRYPRSRAARPVRPPARIAGGRSAAAYAHEPAGRWSLADLRALRWVALGRRRCWSRIAVAIGVAISAQERALRRADGPRRRRFRSADRRARQPDATRADHGLSAAGSAAAGRRRASSTRWRRDQRVGRRRAGRLRRRRARLSGGRHDRGVRHAAGAASRRAEGRVFAREGEAVVGADVRLALGDTITPSHGVAGRAHARRRSDEEEARHRHEGVRYTVVGRLPRSARPGTAPSSCRSKACGRRTGSATAMPTRRARQARPALRRSARCRACRPSSSSRARSPTPMRCAAQYRQGGTMAFFPAEVLVVALPDARRRARRAGRRLGPQRRADLRCATMLLLAAGRACGGGAMRCCARSARRALYILL